MNAPLRRLTTVVMLLFGTLLVASTWIQVADSGSLQARSGNARTLYKEFGRERGPILVAGAPVAESVPVDDAYQYLRTYPQGELYAPVTGFYSIVFGATGIERSSGDLLAGTADQLFYRRISDLLTGTQPQGAAVELTIDPAAQKAAAEALGNQRGAAVALDPRTGDVLALWTSPSFDPNALASHDGAEVRAAREELLADDSRPLDNRAIASRLYPPGSVFKVVTAAAALESGRYTPQTEVEGGAQLDLPQTTSTIGNSGGGACSASGQVTITDALRISCNVAFGRLGLDLGADAIADQAEKFGFGQDLTIPLPVTPSTFPRDASPPSTAQAAIGQFEVRVSPLQMAMVAAGVANDGVVMRPNLVRVVRDNDNLEVVERPRPQQLSRAVEPQTAQELTRMMVEVVENGTGTRAQIDGVSVAGKTGTAQHETGRPPHAWFISFAPADDPQVAVAVVVEDGGDAGSEASGGRVAAPVARTIIEAVLDR